jgi:hypothetical protein
VVAACKDLAGGRLSDPVPVVGDAPTVGNRPDGFVGETLVPAIGGNVPLTGSVGAVIGLGLGDGDVTATTSVAALDHGVAPSADAVADNCHCRPTFA